MRPPETKKQGIRQIHSLHHTTEYTECQAFFQVVRIGLPHPITRKEVLGPRGETHSLAGEGGGVGGPNFDDYVRAYKHTCTVYTHHKARVFP
jgi:hypothetical protein